MNSSFDFKKIITLTVVLVLILNIYSCKLFSPEENDDCTGETLPRIAFLRDRDTTNDATIRDNDIWIMDRNGCNQTQLTFDVNVWDHTFSPDGDKICFIAFYDIYIMNSDGSNVTNLTDDDNWYHLPIFTPDGSKIVFSAELNDYNTDIMIMDVDGANKINLTNSDTIFEVIHDIKPDGAQILIEVITSEVDQNFYFIDLDGTNQTCITCDMGEIAPRFVKITPDGKKIVFCNGNKAIDIVDIDGTNHKNLIKYSSTSGIFIWDIFISTTGDYLLYQDGGNTDIYKINIDGSNNTNLTTNSWGWGPDISNDGQYITFTSTESDTSNNVDIFITNQFGENKTRLTYYGGSSPIFQPIS